MPASTPIFDDVAPWPGENPAGNPRAVMGGNKPPLNELIPVEFRNALLEDVPDFLVLLDGMVGKADPDPEKPEDLGQVSRAFATDDDSLGRCGALVKRIRAAIKHVEDTHRTVKEPYLTAGRLVDGEKNALITRLESGRRKVETVMNEYAAQREAERRAAEAERIAEERRLAAQAVEAERARQAAEGRDEPEAIAAIEAAPLASAAPKRAEPIRSDGATVSTKQVWNSEVTDFSKAFKAVKSDPKVQEAISGAVQRLVKAGTREITGVRIWPTQQAIAR